MHAPPFFPLYYKYTDSYSKSMKMKIQVIFFSCYGSFTNRFNNSVSCISYLIVKTGVEISLGKRKKKTKINRISDYNYLKM